MFYYITYFLINIFKFIKINNKNGLIVVKNTIMMEIIF